MVIQISIYNKVLERHYQDLIQIEYPASRTFAPIDVTSTGQIGHDQI